MTTIIDGKKLAADIQATLALEVENLVRNHHHRPGLAAILVGEDPASQVYVRNKRIACKNIGIESFAYDLPATATEQELLKLVEELNTNPNVHGILVQLPLPKHIREEKIINAIHPEKDVDGFHPLNAGKMFLGKKCFLPCTPAGVIKILNHINIDPRGKLAVVIGKSNIVGKPMAALLLNAGATVTVCHSETKHLEHHVRQADILVVAVGKPKLIPGTWIKPGAVVIDVGINRNAEGKLVGDIEFEEAKKHALAITPVPGGVGPMTIAMLLSNVVEGARHVETNSPLS